MKIDVKLAQKNPEQRFPFAGEITLPAADFNGDEPYGKAAFSGEYYGMGESVYFSGSASVRLHAACDRCGKAFYYDLSAHLSDRFVPYGSAAETDSDFTYKNDSVDVNEYVREKLLLSLPTRRLCKENCSGLCPMCGQDLSSGNCGCIRQKSEAENPFAQLLHLKNNQK